MKLNLLLADDDITTVNHLQEIIERELAGQFLFLQHPMD